MAKYSKEEALEKVLEFINNMEVYPLQEDYDRHFGEDEIDEIVEALGVKGSMKKTKVRPFAAINIAVLRFIREKEGRIINIAGPEAVIWDETNSNLFENQLI